MLTRLCLSLVAVGTAFGPAAPALAGPLRLVPSSPWELREHGDRCRMIRTFGSGDNETTLWIEKAAPGPLVNLTLIGRPVRSPVGPYIHVGFAPGEHTERNFIVATSSKGRPTLMLIGVQPVALLTEPPGRVTGPTDKGEESIDVDMSAAADFASEDTIKRRFSEITALQVSGAVLDPITLELDEMMPMMDKLLNCAAELTKRLSRNPDEEGGMAKFATAVDQADWAQKIQENYPSHLVHSELEGSVSVRLTVSNEGRPTFCEVTGYRGPALFNETACLQILRHAMFDPARDAAGRPVANFWSTKITYKLND